MPEPESEDTLKGSVERVTFHNEENGYSVLRVRVEGLVEPVTLVGTVPRITAGEQVEADGEWIRDSKFGSQFKAKSMKTVAPDSLEGIKRYLGSGLIEGVGKVYAAKIVQYFGKETLDVIETASQRLEEVEGIGKKRRKEIKQSWEQQKAIRGIMVFLHQHGISTARAVKIHKKYGGEALEILRENPYRLAHDLHGVGFQTADSIAKQLGMGDADPARVRAGVLHILDSAALDGHTCLPRPEVNQRARELLGGNASPDDVTNALESLLREGEAVSENLPDRGELIFPSLLHQGEVRIAKRVKEMVGRPATYPPINVEKALAWCAEQTGVALAEGQRAAVRAALTNQLTIITGGPGVGKTTVLNSLLKILGAKKMNAVLAAPTGRAAKRMSESTGLEAQTIHRLLEYQPMGGWGKHSGNPLVCDVLIVDEVSMVDTPLMGHVLDALPMTAHLVLVGDADQLPSVGAGAVLGDLIDSGIVTAVHLTEVYRQAAESAIIKAAHAVNAGVCPDLEMKGEHCDFYFFAREDPDTIRQTIAELVRDKLPKRFGFQAFDDIQILTPMNRNSLGTAALNALLQDTLNPPHPAKWEVERFGQKFRMGDKVIQTRNNYDKEVFNGDIGRVTEVETETTKIRVRFDDGREAAYDVSDLEELQLAYAITIHKSQGSEFPCIILPCSTQHFIMLQRNLLYTGITRGKKLVVLVGQKKAIDIAVKEAGGKVRHTGLRERLLRK